MKRFALTSSMIVIALITTLAYHLLKPDWVLFRKGENYFSKKAYAEAIPCYTRLLKSGFETPKLLNHLGSSYIATGQLEEAAAIFQNMLHQTPENRSVRILLARVLSWSGRFDEAIGEYKKVLGEEK